MAGSVVKAAVGMRNIARPESQGYSTLRPRISKLFRAIRRLHASPFRMNNSPFKAKVDSIEPLTQGKWVQARKINYTDPNGVSRVWEMAVRTTRTDTTGVDAVSILGVLEYPDKPKEIVVTKQFRPPCESVVVELPAGLIDPNESIENTAVRELKEETGYHGEVTRQSITLFSDPGLTNANMALVTVKIDMTDERNKAPKPELEEGEVIETSTLRLSNLYDELVELCKSEKATVDSRLFHLAEGLRLAKSL